MLGYYYPCSGRWAGSHIYGLNGYIFTESGGDDLYYQSIDAGVESPNDSDYIDIYMYRPGSAGTALAGYIDVEPLVVIPNDISCLTVRIRAKTDSLGSAFYLDRYSDSRLIYSMTDESGSVYTATTSAFGTPLLDPTIISGTTYHNYTLSFSQITAVKHTSSGNFLIPASGGIGLDFGRIIYSDIYIDPTYEQLGWNTVVNGVPIQYGNLLISELEIISSGDFQFGPVTNSCTLYTCGPLPSSGNTTLYTAGPIPDSGGCTLYTQAGFNFKDTTLFIGGYDTAETGITLYIDGIGFSSSGCDLYLESEKLHKGVDLFLKVIDPVDKSGSLNLTVWTVGSSSGYALGGSTLHTIATSKISGSTTLFMNSEHFGTFNGYFPLFTDGGKTPSGQIPLFVSGPTPINSSTPFFIEGSKFKISGGAPLFTRNNYYDISSKYVPLTISNRLDSSGGVTLHTLAGFNQNNVPLYLRTLEENDVSGFTPLFIYSASNSGLFQSTTLYIDAVGTSEKIPLYLKTNESATGSAHVTLFTKAGNEFDASVQLYVESVRQSGGSINMNVIGAGLNPDSNVLRNSIPLYMARTNDNFGNGVGLVVNGPSGYTNTVPLSIDGGTFSQKSMSLSVPVVHGQQSGGTNLFTHGF